MRYDAVIVGAGPAGLAAAIRLRQIADEQGRDISVCVLEKAASIGDHTLSGAVIDPIALTELLPDWTKQEAPLRVPVSEDRFWLLGETSRMSLPVFGPMRNEGCYIASLAELVRWLGKQAEEIGVDVFAGFAATELLRDEGGRIAGVATGAKGLDRDGKPAASHEPGVELLATYTLIAEGCRGSLAEQLIAEHNLREGRSPQTYAIGVKELWEVSGSEPGLVLHTLGWPLDRETYGGSFVYRMDRNLISVGMVVGLDYRNPTLSPFGELQRFKHHPAIAPHLRGGKRIAYGARALNEGGWQSIPQLAFPGGLLIGCSAGFLNVPRIKGTHTAMKSGMLAAECVAEQLALAKPNPVIERYEPAVRNSWVGKELREARNVRQGFRRGLFWGMANAALELGILRGRAPWTLAVESDHERLLPAEQAEPISYPQADGKLSFDLLTNLQYAGVSHREGQPCHLLLRDAEAALKVNLARFGGPEQHYCPAGVYEFVDDGQEGKRLQINAANCIHCKTCDIKDPGQNIRWVPPEGGGGPAYGLM